MFCQSTDQLNVPLRCMLCCWWSDMCGCIRLFLPISPRRVETSLLRTTILMSILNWVQHHWLLQNFTRETAWFTEDLAGWKSSWRRLVRRELKAPMTGESHDLWSPFPSIFTALILCPLNICPGLTRRQ